jgi:hypothetical protein
MHRVDELLKRSLLQIDWRMNRFKDLYTVVLIGTVLLICFSVGEIAQHHNNMLLKPLMNEFETSAQGQ